jgi:hypothetical protein
MKALPVSVPLRVQNLRSPTWSVMISGGGSGGSTILADYSARDLFELLLF